jgi:hypothetical protein
MFSLCIPTMDRYDNFLSKYIPLYLKNDLIDEIIISDENGNDIKKINEHFPNNNKLKLFVNEERLGPFMNKIRACSKASNEWIVLMDSDNFADENYFNIANNYLKNNNIEKNSILAPCFAKPKFNYSHLSGFVYKKGMFNKNKELENKLINPSYTNSSVLMNTGNYVINKFLIDNIDLTKEMDDIIMSSACDVIYFNTLLFEQLDLNLHVVPNLTYDHVVHNESIYLQSHNIFSNFNKDVYDRYGKLE